MSDLKGLVKPLVWQSTVAEAGHDHGVMFAECPITDKHLWAEQPDMQAAIEEKHRAKILAALDLAKVEALVKAAEMMVKAYREESDRVITAFYALEDALAAMKGSDK